MQEVTKSVLDLVSARQNLAQVIAQVKESSGAEVENHSVEERLCSEMIAYAKSIGLDEHLANKIVFGTNRILQDSPEKEDTSQFNKDASSL